MTNLRPLAYLSLPILGTLMIMNATMIKPFAKNQILKNLKTKHTLMLVKK